jgi:hypothetical protein
MIGGATFPTVAFFNERKNNPQNDIGVMAVTRMSA